MNLAERLVYRDPHEQLAEVVLLFQAKPARLEAAEKRAKDRLDNVFRIDPAAGLVERDNANAILYFESKCFGGRLAG